MISGVGQALLLPFLAGAAIYLRPRKLDAELRPGRLWTMMLWLSALCMLGHMLGLLCLTYSTGTAMIVAYAILHGTAWGLRGPMMQALRADYFGRSAIGMILGLSFMIMVIGQVGGPMIAGIFADLTGNYRTGFTILALLAGLGSLFFILARKPKRPLR